LFFPLQIHVLYLYFTLVLFLGVLLVWHWQEMRALFRSKAAKGNYSQVLVMLLRLRQSCNHVLLPTGARGENLCFDARAEKSTDNVGLALRQAAEVAGFEFANDASQSSAGVDYAAGQIDVNSLDQLLGKLSIQCAAPNAVDDTLDLADVPDDGGRWQLGCSSAISDSHGSVESTKIEWLVQQLQRVRKADVTDKCVVFSQWTSMLDLIETRLQSEGFGCARLDGECNAQQRAEAIRSFTESPATDIFVFLVSLKAGGVGLNLVRANHTFMMDSWFNPSVEEQACDRIFRIGQTKPTFSHKVLIAGSVEERILKMQEKKKKLANGALCADGNASLKGARKGPMTQLSSEDMRSLFF
jgi:SNF2 family DNA or RNA helicase